MLIWFYNLENNKYWEWIKIKPNLSMVLVVVDTSTSSLVCSLVDITAIMLVSDAKTPASVDFS